MDAGNHLADGIKRATDVMIAGKVAVVLRLWGCWQRLCPILERLRRKSHSNRNRSYLCPSGSYGRVMKLKQLKILLGEGEYLCYHNRQ